MDDDRWLPVAGVAWLVISVALWWNGISWDWLANGWPGFAGIWPLWLALLKWLLG
jgi:hypothetical protein